MQNKNFIKYCLFSILVLCLISSGQITAGTIFLATDGDDSAECAPGTRFATLARAIQCLGAGDTLLIENGVYAGGVVYTVEATAEKPTVIRGESLEAIIDGSPENIDALRIQDCAYVMLENLTIRNAGRAGVAIRFSNHVRTADCLFTNNNTWGLFTSFTDDLTIENCEACSSKVQHGFYHSNSGDRFVIRGNHVHHNNGNGIHLNGDPEIQGGDGVLNEGIVERNVIHHNGASGGAAINMTHVHDIIVRNNLAHNNRAGGVTIYQDTGTFEQGSKRVLVTGNTIYYAPNQGRSGVNIQTTSEKVVVVGNIFVSGGSRGNIQVESQHLQSIFTDYNLYWGVAESAIMERGDVNFSLSKWRTDTGNDAHSLNADPQFGDIEAFDFVPASGSPAVDAAAPLDTVRAMVARIEDAEWLLGRLDSIVQEDIEQHARPSGKAPDIGAYEIGSSLRSSWDFNGDNHISIADALALLLKGLRNSGERVYDINNDSVWSTADVVAMLRLMLADSPRLSSIDGRLVSLR